MSAHVKLYALALLVAACISPAIADPGDVQIAAGASGLTTGMNGVCPDGTSVAGFQVTQVDSAVTRLQAQATDTGDILYDGAVSAGQEITLSSPNFIAVGYTSADAGDLYAAITGHWVCQ